MYKTYNKVLKIKIIKKRKKKGGGEENTTELQKPT